MFTRIAFVCLLAFAVTLPAQQPPYDTPPAVKPPYFRVRYEASAKPGELIFPVQYTVWIPAGVPHALRMNGIEDKIQGYGSLLSHY